jgi:hypothetical protein
VTMSGYLRIGSRGEVWSESRCSMIWSDSDVDDDEQATTA